MISLVIPENLKRNIIEENHDLKLSHQEILTTDKIRRKCTWKGLKKNVEGYVKSCEICSADKATNYFGGKNVIRWEE